MSRVAISEFRAKNIVYAAMGLRYTGLTVDFAKKDWAKSTTKALGTGLYVAKVDQAIKKRNKLGLVTVKRNKKQILEDLANFAKHGYRHALVEPFVPHTQTTEHYISLLRDHNGVTISYSVKGGVDIESHAKSLKTSVMPEDGYNATQNKTGLNDVVAKSLYDLFQKAHMTLLEINPCIIHGDEFIPLDAAVQVDSAAEFFVEKLWADTDTRQPKTSTSQHEKAVEELNAKSPASFNLRVLNPNGSYFLLLSGGGASVVVADELAQRGHHKAIANYGEYSGNPSEEETYSYAQELLQLLLGSAAAKKTLLIAGGVANFTDVSKTFAGIIRAMEDNVKKLLEQDVRVLVRRGGPNQEKGLQAMKDFLEKIGLAHEVYGPEISLAETVAMASETAE